MNGGVRSWDDASADSRAVGELAKAIAYLRRVLGEDWNGWVKGAPLATVFETGFQGGPCEWVRIYRLIEALESAPGVDALVRTDLGSIEWTEYTAALMALEFCGRLCRGARRVEFIETEGHSNPADAIVEVAGRSVTVEFKALHGPDAMKEWDELMDWTTAQMVSRGCDLAAIEVDCEPAALLEREAFLDGLLAVNVSRAPEFRPLPRGTGRARYTGLNTEGWRFPVTHTPDLDRIIGKLLGKWWKKFCDATTPTLLVVRTGMLFGENAASMLSKAEIAATRLRATLESLRTIGAILIYDEILWQPPAPTFFGTPAFRLSTGAVDGWARATLVVTNSNAAIPLTEAELEALVGPRMLW
ncbi:MAG: hypothetical protein ABI548_25725 [Polyangiaceae bacterium]